MDRNGRILFSSLKGGVGKSSAACEVAVAIASLGKRVLIVDLDFRSRSLDLMLGVADNVIFDVGDLAAGKCGVGSALVEVSLPKAKKSAEHRGKLLLCPACSEAFFDKSVGDYGKLPEVLRKLESDVMPDFVIIDTGADIRIPTAVANGYADLALVVSEQSRTSVRASETTASRLRDCESVREVRLIINNFDIEAARRGGRAGILEMIDDCATRCIGVIPHDPMLPTRQDAGVLLSCDSPVSKAARNITARIMGASTPLFAGMKKERRRAIL